METSTAVIALGALAHEGRLGVFRMLMQTGDDGMAAGEIARRLGAPPNSLSANLKVLSHAGLIVSRREGRSVIYSACYDRMASLLGYLVADCCQGSPAVCAPLADVMTTVRRCAGSDRATSP